jgi:uncharacterized protein
MGLNPVRVYWDSCIAIYYVERHNLFFPYIRDRLISATGTEPAVVLSDLTRLECRVYPIRSSNDSLLARFDEFFGLPDLEWVIMNRQVFDLATDFRARFGLKTPDALHLAAAFHQNCDEFWTNDLRLQSAAAGRLSIVNPIQLQQ